jgi:hypothetical protein
VPSDTQSLQLSLFLGREGSLRIKRLPEDPAAHSLFLGDWMAGLKLRLTAIFALYLFAASPIFAKGSRRQPYDRRAELYDAAMPQEVLSAKTLALVVKVIGGPERNTAAYKQRIEANAVAEVQKRGRFQLVSDPNKADLVCMLLEFSYDYWHDAYQPGKGFIGKMHGRTWNTMPPGAIFVFKGGADPHRTAQPVWVKTRIMGVATAFKARHEQNTFMDDEGLPQGICQSRKERAPRHDPRGKTRAGKR